MELSQSFGAGRTQYPAPVLTHVKVSTLDGRAHNRLLDGMIDTGADYSVLPFGITSDLRLGDVRQRVRVWSYRKEEGPREMDVYYIRFSLATDLEMATKAIAAERTNILIGRSALMTMRLMVNWPANQWSLEESRG